MPLSVVPLSSVNANRLQAALIQRAHARGRFGQLATVDATAARWITTRAATFRRFYVRHTATI